MPIHVGVDPSGGFAVVTITDPYTFDEWRDAMQTLLDSIVYGATAGVLVDRRAATPPSLEFIDRMMGFFSSHQDRFLNGRTAIVVDETVAAGMGRMLELKAQVAAPSVLIRVFRDYDTAARWLRGRPQ